MTETFATISYVDYTAPKPKVQIQGHPLLSMNSEDYAKLEKFVLAKEGGFDWVEDRFVPAGVNKSTGVEYAAFTIKAHYELTIAFGSDDFVTEVTPHASKTVPGAYWNSFSVNWTAWENDAIRFRGQPVVANKAVLRGGPAHEPAAQTQKAVPIAI